MGTKKGSTRGPYKKHLKLDRAIDLDEAKAAKKRFPINPAAVVPEKEYEQYRKAKLDKFWGRNMTEKKEERLERFRHALALEKRNADDRCWLIDGNYYNRYEVMKMILMLVSEGYTVVEVSRFPGYPPVWMIREWERLQMGFKNELKLAQQAAAEIRYQDSIDIVMEATNDDNAKLVQLQSEAQAKLAAQLHDRWNVKQQMQIEDTTKPVDLEDAKKRLEGWARANPELAKKMMPELHAQLQEKLEQQTIGYTDAEEVKGE